MGYCEDTCEYLTSRHNCKKYHKGLTYCGIDIGSVSTSYHERCSECDKDYLLKTQEKELTELRAILRESKEATKIEKLRKELRKERKRWHKVADGDLPQGPYSKKRKFYCKEKGYGYRILLYDDKGFYYYSFDLNIGIENEQIVAWMELPEYEEDRP